jgi:hypothetical protein
MKRFVEFDILRGVLLLMMVVDHSPSALRRFTDQPLRFFTTAECFVFLSAFLAGLIFRKREKKTGLGRLVLLRFSEPAGSTWRISSPFASHLRPGASF